MPKGIHTKKYDRCVKKCEAKQKKPKKKYNCHAVCTSSIGYEGSVRKEHRRKTYVPGYKKRDGTRVRGYYRD